MPIEEIRQKLTNEKLIIGAERTLKALRKNKLEKIWLAKNPKPEIKEEITRYAQINKTTVETLKETNEDLGIVCKKQHAISVISLLK